MKKDNIIFAGCSFTWGQGLWSYLETDEHVPSYEEWIFENKPLPFGSHEIREKLRFANIVADSLNSNSIVKYNNGGCDDESLRFINYLFDKELDYETHFPIEKYEYSDISYVIYQTSQLSRNTFEFEFNSDLYSLKSTPDSRSFDFIEKKIKNKNGLYDSIRLKDFNPLYEWMYENNYEVADVLKKMSTSLLDKIESLLSKLSDNGIQVRIICWTDEYFYEFDKRDFFKDKLVELTYNNESFRCIEHLYQKYSNMRLDGDSSVLHHTGKDEHPSRECHRVIANSILNTIKK
jgi:hypothetical protein